VLSTLFFGTPETAVPFLERLDGKSRLLGVVTSPDKPAGRGYALTPPAVKRAAEKLGRPVLQPASLKDPAFHAALAAWGPADLGVVVAYGKLIPPAIFDLPRFGLMNAHFSLLPKYRGAAPVQWALMRGETLTGVSLFRIEKGLDTGPVYLQKPVAVRPEDTSASLRARLADEGLALLEEVLARFEAGGAAAIPQTGEPSLAPILKKEDGRVDWAARSAKEIANLVRGAWEWPGAFCQWKGQTLKIRAAEPRPWSGSEAPGTVVAMEKGRGFLIKSRDGALLLLRVQPEGKKELDAWGFWNGARLSVGDVLR
jgi:methionyl-tRNA formyltransferase